MWNNLSNEIRDLVEAAGFEEPTEVQKAAWKPMLEAENFYMVSPTGTGKTLAYLLPLLESIEGNGSLQAVVLAPSQDLAAQIAEVARHWAKVKGIKIQSLAGGANIKRQIEKLKQKPELVVGTAGRLNELAQSRKLKLHQVDRLVLDECDRLFSPEQLATTKAFIDRLQHSASLAAFSATANAEAWAHFESLRPEVFFLDCSQASQALTAKRQHLYLKVASRKRDDALRRLAQVEGMQALVFVRSIAELERLGEKLSYRQVPVAILHSEMTSQERQQAIQGFRQGKYRYLLTTDVAARGMDIPQLPYVIQYDEAEDRATYTHRSGRTGRMGAEGSVLTFVTDRSLRELNKQVPDQAVLEEVFLSQGQLTKQAPAHRDQGSHKAKPSKKQDKPSKNKNKKRKRQQKNKGARRQKK
ncbi:MULTISPECIES: DEAD/DEAH box helicase [Aerococcus]|uniref:DEAD/DEAH box helicase n=2 Tax=Aerococcus TaxID=1375 RepID=A0A5N1GQB6_9LACT|nr:MULTISPECIES: DEAD/DEAH box helicase [Aerococcus]KAA9302449.1 DEAD/DEAH box helicase [Aerococcus sanguinicola]MDK6369824.1 DEAD/DEAH box helicase [Aerococcus sp. UMB9870]MDK6680464.1 DEAD/DEAH box helicase [Aerococcus sp. UMB8608]MDK6687039.1 DEAD/DEAH box helicase [Aerococcus sp. UMB8623]MDK6940258.1 DEAD/DEAH box helicase [Aerococcus sp. UMB8487]